MLLFIITFFDGVFFVIKEFDVKLKLLVGLN